jgi:hypothetical protein
MTDALSHPGGILEVAAKEPDILKATIATFCRDTEGFLAAMSGVWPECPAVARLCDGFEATVNCSIEGVRDLARQSLIRTFHDNMKPYYQRARQNDGSIFFGDARNVDVLRDIQMDVKWRDSGIDDTTRSTIFAWLNRLCGSAELWSFYVRVPANMLNRLTGVAMTMASECDSGDGGINPANLESTITDLMTGLDQDELQNFAESIMSEPSSLQSLMGMVGRLGAGPGNQAAMPPQVQGLVSMVQTMAGASALGRQ